MKLCLIFLLAFAASITCAPQATSEASADIKSSDEVAFEDIESMFASFGEYKAPFTLTINKKQHFLSDKILPSIDRQCMLTEYKKHDYVDKIDMQKLKPYSDRMMAKWTFIAVAAPCSSKFSPLMEFVFENAMTLNIIWKTFKDDEEFSPFNEALTCANSYAVKNNYLDPEEFAFRQRGKYRKLFGDDSRFRRFQ